MSWSRFNLDLAKKVEDVIDGMDERLFKTLVKKSRVALIESAVEELSSKVSDLYDRCVVDIRHAQKSLE